MNKLERIRQEIEARYEGKIDGVKILEEIPTIKPKTYRPSILEIMLLELSKLDTDKTLQISFKSITDALSSHNSLVRFRKRMALTESIIIARRKNRLYLSKKK